MKQPNIVIIQSDSMDGRLMGCMGHPALRRATPRLDALAARGVLFRNTYTNAPICCPSRSSSWSGRYVHNCRAWNNIKGLDENEITLRDPLEAAGYHVEEIGKLDYTSENHTERARLSAIMGPLKVAKPHYNLPEPQIFDSQEIKIQQRDWNKIDQAESWLREYSGSDKPFMLYLGVSSPHPPYKTSRYHTDRLEKEFIGIPAEDRDDHPVMAYQRAVKNCAGPFDEEYIKLVRGAYMGMISETDAMAGRVLDLLEELGLTDTTHIIYTSDHGEMACEHNQYYKSNFYEPVARVPLIIAGPGLEQGMVCDDLTSLVDLLPTVVDLAGAELPPARDGASLRPELTGAPCNRPPEVFSEFHGSGVYASACMLRRGNWKYIEYTGDEPMLFHLDTDPDEINNLAADNPQILEDMAQQLRRKVPVEQVTREVAEYNRESFRVWRREHIARGDYLRILRHVFSGFDYLQENEADPNAWGAEEERRACAWLGLPPQEALI